MQLSPIRFLVLMSVGIAAIVTVALFSARVTASLHNQAAAVRSRESALDELRRERDALAAREPSTAALEQALRDQTAIDSERAALLELRAAYQGTALEAMRRVGSPAAPSLEPSRRDTPEAALQSVIRAIAGGEAEELAGLIDFDSSAREQAEQFFASLSPDLREQYESPDQLVAHVMTAKTNRLNAIAVVDRLEFLDSDHASLRVNLERPNGQFRTATFQLHRASDGWRLRVPAKVIEGYRALVTGRWAGNGRNDESSSAAAISLTPISAAAGAAP